MGFAGVFWEVLGGLWRFGWALQGFKRIMNSLGALGRSWEGGGDLEDFKRIMNSTVLHS